MRALYEKIVLGPGESFSYRQFRVPRFEMPWHFHVECELTLIVRGRGMRYVGDSIERFEDGDLVLLASNLPHYWWKDAEDGRRAHSVVIQFEPKVLGGALIETPEAGEIRRLMSVSGRGVKFSEETAEEGARLLMKMGERSGWRRFCLLLELFGVLGEGSGRRALASAGYAPVLDERDGKRLSAVCKYVNECYAEEIAHGHAATLAGLSPGAFSRFFHKRMGKTFEGYVIEMRLGHACRRLLEEDATVAEIAYGTGFNNLSNFNRQFRRLKGMAPVEYRRRVEGS
jgi:AraC-like DNA-binding protein/quercetin dioxygenase-like cupin family protein